MAIDSHSENNAYFTYKMHLLEDDDIFVNNIIMMIQAFLKAFIQV